MYPTSRGASRRRAVVLVAAATNTHTHTYRLASSSILALALCVRALAHHSYAIRIRYVRSPSHTHVSRITRMLPYLPRRLLHPRPSPHASPSYLSTVRLRALAHHPFACYTYTVRTLSLSHTQRLSHHSHATHTHTCARTISLVLLTLPPHTLYPQHTAAARRIEVVKRAIGAGSTLATT